MKLEPKCRRVKIRIESGGKSCTTLDDLKRNFVIDDIFPLVQDGRLVRWLRDLKKEDEATEITNISHDMTDENKRKKLVEIFFPRFLNTNDAVASLVLQQLESAEISKSVAYQILRTSKTKIDDRPIINHWEYIANNFAEKEIFEIFDAGGNLLPFVMQCLDEHKIDKGVAYQILHIFKNVIDDYKLIVTHWDRIAKYFTETQISDIISPFKDKQKDVAYLWAKYLKDNGSELSYLDAIEVAAKLGHSEAIKERDELYAKDPYLWRETVQKAENLPTTPAELKELFERADKENSKNFVFCKRLRQLNDYYRDVYEIYKKNEIYRKFHQAYSKTPKEELVNFIRKTISQDNDAVMWVERKVINFQIEWYEVKQSKRFPRFDIPYKFEYPMAGSYSKSWPVYVYRGYGGFCLVCAQNSNVLWERIVDVTVNIFNKERYPDWK